MALRQATRLVGREGELGALSAAVDAARSGKPELIFIEGEAGVGKTRLLIEALDHHLPRDGLMVVAHGVELMGDQLPYGIITEAVRSIVRARGPEGVARLPDSARGVVDVFNSPEPSAALEDLRRADLFGGLANLCEALATEGFVWLVIEDIHWADESSLELLAYLARVVTVGSLLATYTVRTGSGRPSAAFIRFATETRRAPSASTITLSPLGRTAAEAMVTDLMQEHPSRTMMERLLRLGNGNPFLTEELVYGGLTADGPVPASPRAAMVARIGRLSHECAELVGTASLAHGPFSLDHLRNLTRLDDDRLDAVLEEAGAQGILEPGPASDEFRFHHALLKEAIAGSLPPSRRRRDHHAWAELRERDSAHETEPWFATVAAAHHWLESGDLTRGFDACVAAVRLAPTFHAPSERAPLLAEALRLWDRVPDAEARSGRSRDQLAMDAVRAAHFAGDWDGALQLIEAELGHADSDSDPVRRATLELSRQGTLEQLGRGALEDLVPRLDELADVLLTAPDGPWLTNGCLDAAWRIGVSPNPEKRSALLQRAAAAAKAQDDPVARLNAGQNLADNLLAERKLDDALEVVHEILELTNTRLPERVSDVEAQLSWMLCFRGDLAKGIAVAERAMRRLPPADMSSRLFAYVAGGLAYALIEAGRWDEAARWLGEGRAAYPSGWTAFELQSEAIRLSCYRGDLSTADREAEELWHLVPRDERGALVSLGRGGNARIAKATVAAYRGDVIEVRDVLGPVWATPDLEEETDVAWRVVLLASSAEADAANRTRGRSARHTERSAESDRHVGTVQRAAAAFYTPGMLGDTWPRHLAAEVSRYRQEDTAEMWQAVADAWEEIGVPHDRGWALLHAAECHLLEDARDSAQAAVLAADEVAQRLGAKPLTQAVRSLAERSRLRLDVSGASSAPSVTQHLAGLTARELDVFKLMARGHSNGEIGDLLFISPKTVSVHASHIFEKLGVRSRTEAMALAFRSGVVEE